MLLAHRAVRLQNLAVFVSDWYLTSRFSMICQGTRSVEKLLANGDYTTFARFVNAQAEIRP